MAWGILASKSVLLSDIARSLGEKREKVDKNGRPPGKRAGRDVLYTVKRLSRNLCSDRLDDEGFRTAVLERVQPHLHDNDGEGVVIGVDYTDISKPFAKLSDGRGMEKVSICWNGSEHKKGPGYPVAQFEAVVPNARGRDFRGHTIPLRYHLYSFKGEDFATGSQNKTFIEQMTEIAPYVGSRAIWAMDRGFASKVIFDACEDLGLRMLTRLKIRKDSTGGRNRTLILFTDDGSDEFGHRTNANDLAESIDTPFEYTRPAQFGEKRRKYRFGAVHVRRGFGQNSRRADERDYTLIVSRGVGKNKKSLLALLVNERVEGRRAIVEMYEAYIKRWRVEEANRQMKDSDGWGFDIENVRALTFRGVQRLLRLAVVARLFLCELEMAGDALAESVIQKARATGRRPKDLLYRLACRFGCP